MRYFKYKYLFCSFENLIYKMKLLYKFNFLNFVKLELMLIDYYLNIIFVNFVIFLSRPELMLIGYYI